MKNRLISGLLCAVLVLTMLPSLALAAPLPSEAEAAQVLSALDIMTGNEQGDLMLDRTITRAEFTKLVVAASTFRDSVGPETATDPYPDVPRTHWAAGYVQAAVNAGLVRGNLQGQFEPARNITLAEGVTMVLRLLGYQDSEFNGKYPAGQMAQYRALELDAGVGTASDTGDMTRRDALYLFYNLMTTKTKDGSAYYANVLKPGKGVVDANGEIDTVALINSAMEGPVVASGNWSAKLPFDASTATVYRAGAASSFAAISSNDVVYYSKPMRTLWVYTNRATGTIQAITPASAPTSVTVAGKSYGIETTSAAYALSDLGPFRVGDSATLLLGRDGKVVSVLEPTVSNSMAYGVVTKVEPDSYEDADGNSYTASTITVLATDGNPYTYRYDKKNIKAGNVVQATSTGGKSEVKVLTSGSLSGKVNAAGTSLGGYDFADDVEILDTYGDHGVRVYPSRLAGMNLTSDMVRWYLLDGNGDISRLILKDATGDMHTYGVVTSVSEVNSSDYISTQGGYAYDSAGTPGAVQGTKVYNVKTGPFLLKTDGGDVDKFVNLDSVKLTGAEGNTAYANNRKYLIWDDVLVYEVRDSKYYLSSLALVSGGDFTLTGYYDKAESEGGRIRVILAK